MKRIFDARIEPIPTTEELNKIGGTIEIISKQGYKCGFKTPITPIYFCNNCGEQHEMVIGCFL